MARTWSASLSHALAACAVAACVSLAGCGAVQPAGPGHEPPSAQINPETGTRTGGQK